MANVEWADGAHEGIGADEAMRAAIGGKEPERERLTSAGMRAMLEAAPLDEESYDGAANATGRLVLEFLDRHPEAQAMPSDSDYAWPKLPSGATDWNGTPILTIEGLYEYMKRVEPDWFESHRDLWVELSGFMWGWAVNAARYALDLPPVPNPALVTIAVGE